MNLFSHLQLFLPRLIEVLVQFLALAELLLNLGFTNALYGAIGLCNGDHLLIKWCTRRIHVLTSYAHAAAAQFTPQLGQFLLKLADHTSVRVFIDDSMVLDPLRRVRISERAQCLLEIDVRWGNGRYHGRQTIATQ